MGAVEGTTDGSAVVVGDCEDGNLERGAKVLAKEVGDRREGRGVEERTNDGLLELGECIEGVSGRTEGWAEGATNGAAFGIQVDPGRVEGDSEDELSARMEAGNPLLGLSRTSTVATEPTMRTSMATPRYSGAILHSPDAALPWCRAVSAISGKCCQPCSCSAMPGKGGNGSGIGALAGVCLTPRN